MRPLLRLDVFGDEIVEMQRDQRGDTDRQRRLQRIPAGDRRLQRLRPRGWIANDSRWYGSRGRRRKCPRPWSGRLSYLQRNPTAAVPAMASIRRKRADPPTAVPVEETVGREAPGPAHAVSTSSHIFNADCTSSAPMP